MMNAAADSAASALTASDLRVLRALHLLTTADHGRPPSLREMCRALDWASTNAVGECYYRLDRAGLITRTQGNRGARVTDAGRALLDGPTERPGATADTRRGVYKAEGLRAVARLIVLDDEGPLYRVEIEADHVDALDGAAIVLRVITTPDGYVTDAEGERYEAGVDGWTPLVEAYEAAEDAEVHTAIRCALALVATPRAA